MNSKNGSGAFALKPDIIIDVAVDRQVIIDTKWKWINPDMHRNGVSSEDFYQMYAYLTRYEKAKTVILLYPRNDAYQEEAEGLVERYHVENKIDERLNIIMVDYENRGRCIEQLKKVVVDR